VETFLSIFASFFISLLFPRSSQSRPKDPFGTHFAASSTVQSAPNETEIGNTPPLIFGSQTSAARTTKTILRSSVAETHKTIVKRSAILTFSTVHPRRKRFGATNFVFINVEPLLG